MSALAQDTAALSAEPHMRPATSLWRNAGQRFLKNKLAVGALVVMILLILTAVFADVIAPAPYDYSVLTEANQFPNRQHLLGTDTIGRDFLSRLIYGTRVSLTVGFSVQAIALRHLLPNALSPLIVAVTLGVPTAIFTEAGLSFLGFGINDPLPSWGKMVADSSSYIRVYWHLGLFPTLMIAITMLSFSFVGDGLRDALDPHLNK